MDWPRLSVRRNDQLVQDRNMARSDALRRRFRSGYIGFEDLGKRFRLRNIRIKELPSKAEPWTELFNGRDLEGWQTEGSAHWRVEAGKIVGGGGDGVLRTAGQFSRFDYRMYFKTEAHANGGLFYRWKDRGEGADHYEIQVYNVPTATNPTGSIYGIVPASDGGCRSGEWCLLQLISDGPYSSVLINGRTVAEAHDLSLSDEGHLAIQNHSEGEIVYARPRVRSLEE